MTKKELQVIKETENGLYKELKEWEKGFGEESATYKALLARWSGIYELVQALGIEKKVW